MNTERIHDIAEIVISRGRDLLGNLLNHRREKPDVGTIHLIESLLGCNRRGRIRFELRKHL